MSYRILHIPTGEYLYMREGMRNYIVGDFNTEYAAYKALSGFIKQLNHGFLIPKELLDFMAAGKGNMYSYVYQEAMKKYLYKNEYEIVSYFPRGNYAEKKD